MAATPKPTRGSTENVRSVINGAMAELRDAMKADGPKFFANGIELIDIQVKVVNVEVRLKVAGPKAASLLPTN